MEMNYNETTRARRHERSDGMTWNGRLESYHSMLAYAAKLERAVYSWTIMAALETWGSKAFTG